MALSIARRTAYQILLRIEREGAYAGELLRAHSFAALEPSDRALTHELVMGSLRWRIALDAELEAASGKKLARFDAEVATALRIGLYQLRRLERVPARAAVDQSVELVKFAHKRSAMALTNAVLRKLSQKSFLTCDATSDDAAELSLAYSHPQWLVERWLKQYGAEATRAMLAADQLPPAPAIRLSDEAAAQMLVEDGLTLEPGALLASARRGPGSIAQTRAFAEGRAAHQDEASQLIAHLAGRGERILDACAAPGGKTLILAANNPQAKILACELHEGRSRQLAERLQRCANVEVRAQDASTLIDEDGFDLILADLPCSGTGTLARNPEIKLRLRPADIEDLGRRQRAILANLAGLLRVRGRLVVSTCSLEPEEGEELIAWLCSERKELRRVDCREFVLAMRKDGRLVCEPELVLRGEALRTLPGLAPCEGFFAAVLERGE